MCCALIFSSESAADADVDHVPPANELRDGDGESYWGVIPARSDSAAMEAKLEKTPRPAWEYPLLVPQYILKVPLWLVFSGLGAGYTYMDESGAIYKISQLFAPKLIPYGVTGTIDAASLDRFGLGLTFFHNEFFGSNNRARLIAKVSRSSSHRIALGTFFNHDGATSLEVGGGYRSNRTARYFGLGPESSQDDKSFYTQETSWSGVNLHQKVIPKTHAELMALYSAVGARRPAKLEPALEDSYPPDEIPNGYGEFSTGATFSLSLVRNTTQTDGRPDSGNIQRLKVSYFHATNGDKVSFWSYRGEFETFIPAWFTDRAFAIRGYINWLDVASESIPFQRLLTNEEPDQFRGYRDARFRDRGITALSVEYRWAVWANRKAGETGLDGYIATDLGQVFDRFQQINSKNVTISYVFGFRGVRASGFAWRAEFGWSKDEFVVRFTSDQIFQFVGENLFHGREAAALR